MTRRAGRDGRPWGRRSVLLPALAVSVLVLTVWAVDLATAWATVAPLSQPNMFVARGAGAQEIRTLAFEIFAILSGVLLTVWVLLAIVVIRGRRRPESEVSKTAGNLGLETAWTVIPAVLVAVLLVLSIRTAYQLVVPDPGLRFNVVAHQWWWEFDFNAQHFKTANEVYVPNERNLFIDVTSADVIHGFWVPQMGGKIQAIPGRVNNISFTPVQKGSYVGLCANFCGVEHARMQFVMKVVSTAQYVAWVQLQQQPAATATGAEAIAGSKLMPTIACGGCHTVRGTTMKGTFAPDLTHFGSRGGIGAYSLVNTPQNLLKWVQNPQAVKPGCRMPQIPLPLQQQQELVAYLEELK